MEENKKVAILENEQEQTIHTADLHRKIEVFEKKNHTEVHHIQTLDALDGN